jgi:hypothetical protein
MEADVAKSADTGDTEWDRRSYNLFAVPTSRMANSPRSSILRSPLKTTEPGT